MFHFFSAFSHDGMLGEGYHYLLCMYFHDVTPTAEHYHCMIDLLGRAGRLDEAEDVINKMPFKPTALSWMTLLGACRNIVDVERGEHAAKHIFEIDPTDTSLYVVLAHMYVATGRVDEAENLMKIMKGLEKRPCCSMI